MAVLSVLIVTPPGVATQVLQLHITRLDGDGWQVRDGKLELIWRSPDKADVRLSVGSLQLPGPLRHISGMTLQCHAADIGAHLVSCNTGTLRLDTPFLGPQPMRVTFRYQRASRAVQFRVENAAFAGGTVSVTGQFDSGRWQLQGDATALNITQLSASLVSFLPSWASDVQMDGTLRLRVRLSGHGAHLASAELNGALHQFSFSDKESLRVGENLHTTFAIAATAQSDSWHLKSTVAVERGQVYVEPVFVEVQDQRDQQDHPVRLTITGKWHPRRGRLSIAELQFNHPDVLQVSGQLTLSTDPSPHLISGALHVARTPLAGLYRVYVQPFLIGTALDDLDTSGHVAFVAAYENGKASSAQVTLDQMQLTDRQDRYGLAGITGTLTWTIVTKEAVRSTLSWQEGHFYSFGLGRSEIVLEAHGPNVRLLNRTELPILDGALHIDRLVVTQLGTPHVQWQFRGELAPMSMTAFSEAVGWPPLSGNLSGAIPQVTYADDTVAVHGSIRVQVFDGNIIVSDLRLERPLGVAPRLAADIMVEQIDLETLTRTFSFGEVQGRISGGIRSLRLEDWQPVSFHAHFATPNDDPSPHRISQKAVDSLSSLGGVGGAVSRSFLGFFDNFSYARLGLSCRLQYDVCIMDGLEPADNGGYYMVKGGGLPPRIDVIGHVRRVAWRELLDRLQRATSGQAPEVR